MQKEKRSKTLEKVKLIENIKNPLSLPKDVPPEILPERKQKKQVYE